MNRLIALYPAAWRARYGDEFEAVLASRPKSIGERVDILRGAVDAHLNPQVPAPMRVRDRYWISPLLGLVSLAAALIIAVNGPLHQDDYGSYRDGGAALPFLALALVLLSVGLYRVVEQLPVDAGGGRAPAGWTAIIAGPCGPWCPGSCRSPSSSSSAVVGLVVGARRAGIVPSGRSSCSWRSSRSRPRLFAATFFPALVRIP